MKFKNNGILTLFGLCTLKYSVNTEVPDINKDTICPVKIAYIVNPERSNIFILFFFNKYVSLSLPRYLYSYTQFVLYVYISICNCCSSEKMSPTGHDEHSIFISTCAIFVLNFNYYHNFRLPPPWYRSTSIQ